MAGFNPDIPISKKSEDKLRRYPLAKNIAAEINHFDKNASFTIGIEGKWGSGKTVLVNFLLKDLRSKEDNLIVEFNPWNFLNQNELIMDFFNSVAEGLGRGKKSEIQKIRKQLRDYEAKLLRSDKTDQTKKSRKWWWTRPKSEFSLNELRQEVDKFISSKITVEPRDGGTRKKRMIIMIDDVDRLDSADTKLVLKLVRLTANFPRTVFILAYDRSKVSARLDKDDINGEEYLKKFIQLPYTLPKLKFDSLKEILEDAIIDELKLRNFDDKKLKGDKRWKRLMNSDFIKLFPTIRDIRRYTNSLRLNLKIIDKDTVNPIDFVGTEAIRIFAPEAHGAMSDKKEAFIGTTEDNEGDIRGVIQKAPSELRDIIKKGVIFNLFPEFERIHLNNADNAENAQETIKETDLRVCVENTFDKYFSPTVIKKEAVKDFLSSMETDEELEKYRKTGQPRLFIEGLIEYSHTAVAELEASTELEAEPGLNGEQIRLKNMLVSIFGYMGSKSSKDIIPVWREVPEAQNVYEQAAELGEYVLGKMEHNKKGQQASFSIIEGIIESKSVKDISFPIRLITYMEKEFEDHEKKKNEDKKSDTETFTTRGNLQELKKRCAQRIKEARDNKSLHNSIWFYETLGCWYEIKRGEAQRYIEELLKGDVEDGLFKFLDGLAKWEIVTKYGYSENVIKIDRERIDKFSNLDDLIMRINRTRRKDEKEAKRVEFYKNLLKDSKENSEETNPRLWYRAYSWCRERFRLENR